MATIVQIRRRSLLDQWDTYENLLSSLKASIQSTSQEIEEQAQLFEDDLQKDMFYESFEPEQTKTLIQMNALFAILFALFEFQLVEICRIERWLNSKSAPLDLGTGSVMRSVEQYLKKSHGIKSPFSSPEWKRADRYREIRNIIMHAGGVIDPDNPSLDGNDKKKIKEREKRVEQYALAQGIAIPPGEAEDGERIVRTLALTPKFCDYALSTYRKFITNLIGVCEVEKRARNDRVEK